MLDENIISTIKDFAIQNSDKDDIHGFLHVERVYKLCMRIGIKLNANLKILAISAMLHDIGRIKEETDPNKRNHAEISAEIVHIYLKSNDFNLSDDQINKIVHCIRAHSFSNNFLPKTLEAKILSDADKLDALGAIGLYRTIGFTVKNDGDLKQVIQHLDDKIRKLSDLLYLKYSIKIAKKRRKIIEDFYRKIIHEK